MGLAKHVTLIKDPGFTVPDDVVINMLGKYKAAMGVAVAVNGEVFVTRFKAGVTPEQFKRQLNDAFKDKQLLINLMANPEDELVHEDDLQPFEIVCNTDGKPVLVASLDGNFENFLQQESTHSPESFAVKIDLVPRLQKIYGWVNGDIAKIMQELRDPVTCHDLMNNMVGSRGSVTFLGGNGDIASVSVTGDSSHKKFDWGWLSNVEGIIKAASTPVASTSSNPFAALEQAVGVVKSVAATATAAVASKMPARPGQKQVQSVQGNVAPAQPADGGNGGQGVPPAPATPQSAPGNDGSSPVAAPTDAKVIFNGPQAKGRKEKDYVVVDLRKLSFDDSKAKGKFIRKMCEDFLPHGWQDATHMKVLRSKLSGHSRKEIRALANLGPALQQQPLPEDDGVRVPVTQPAVETPPPGNKEGPVSAVKMPRRPGAQAAKAQEQPAAAPPAKVTEPTNPNVVTEPLPVIPPGQMQVAHNILNAEEGKSLIAKSIQDPNYASEVEKKVPDFHSQMGIDAEFTEQWPFELKLKMARSCPDLMAVLEHNRLRTIQKLRGDLAAAEELLHNRVDTSGVQSQQQQAARPASHMPKRPRAAA